MRTETDPRCRRTRRSRSVATRPPGPKTRDGSSPNAAQFTAEYCADLRARARSGLLRGSGVGLAQGAAKRLASGSGEQTRAKPAEHNPLIPKVRQLEALEKDADAISGLRANTRLLRRSSVSALQFISRAPAGSTPARPVRGRTRPRSSRRFWTKGSTFARNARCIGFWPERAGARTTKSAHSPQASWSRPHGDRRGSTSSADHGP